MTKSFLCLLFVGITACGQYHQALQELKQKPSNSTPETAKDPLVELTAQVLSGTVFTAYDGRTPRRFRISPVSYLWGCPVTDCAYAENEKAFLPENRHSENRRACYAQQYGQPVVSVIVYEGEHCPRDSDSCGSNPNREVLCTVPYDAVPEAS